MNKKDFKYFIYLVVAILIMIYINYGIIIKSFYQDIKIITNPKDNLVLVNKNNVLKSEFVPDDLKPIDLRYSNMGKYLRKEAQEAFENLSQDASLLGYKIIAVSAYRDYDYQKKLYEEYVTTKGLEYADNSSARPGHSEHQTGLAVDVMGSNNDYDEFASSLEFPWMKNNAHLYGFILRYPKGKEHITGFKYEPWHYRFVGVKAASYIYEHNMTLEEYLN